MCRYAWKTYKSHFACFDCRKTFKQPDRRDLLRAAGKSKRYDYLNRKPAKRLSEDEVSELAELNSLFKDREIRCPECSKPMADLGFDFKSPRKAAIKEWKIIESLYKLGKCFHSCGCVGPGYIPKNPSDYEQYLRNTLVDFEKSIAYYQNRTFEEYPDKGERVNYWVGKVEEIKVQLAKRPEMM